MTGFLVLALLLAVLALTDGGAGPRSPRAAGFLALLVLVPLLAVISRDTTRGRLARWIVIAAAAAAFWWTSGNIRLFVLAAALGSAAFVARPTAAGRTAALAAFLFAAFALARDTVPLWVPLSNLSERMSVFAAGAAGAEARFGPTRFGVWTAFAAVALALATAATNGRRAFAGAAIAIVVALLVPSLALVLDTFADRNARLTFLWPGQEEAVGWLLLLPIAWLARLHAPATSTPPSKRRVFGAAALTLMGVVLLAGSRGVPEGKPRILLEGRGGFSLDRLAWGSYGPEAPQGASLASLPDALSAWGFPLTISSSALTPEMFAEQDVLVVMNPKAAFTPSEHAAVWEFVNRGGGLLVLGDHTNILGSGAPLDSLLAPAGIRVAFDSAIPEVERWTWYGCARMAPHPALREVRDENDMKISVGASLVLHGNAVPIIFGRHAFSDAGDSTNARGAFLGNMQPDPGERRGDLVVAAEARHGRGKVIAFGDTSPFQRGAITHSRDLVMRLFVYLGRPGHVTFDAPARGVGAVCLAAGCLLLFFSGAAAAAGGVAALAALSLGVIDRTARVDVPEPDRSRFAWIDVSHGNRVDLHAGRDEGISGLSDQLSRHGWLPLAMKQFDAEQLAKARAFVTVAPAFPFRENEREALVRFVEEGGLLVVASGYEEGRGSASLLAEFGFSIGSTPLGAAHAAESRVEGTGVLMNEAWPVLSAANDVIVLAETWDIPFIAMRRVGRGAVLVIGDSRFLGDSKLETAEQAVEANIEFFRRSVDMALAPAGSS